MAVPIYAFGNHGSPLLRDALDATAIALKTHTKVWKEVAMTKQKPPATAMPANNVDNWTFNWTAEADWEY